MIFVRRRRWWDRRPSRSGADKASSLRGAICDEAIARLGRPTPGFAALIRGYAMTKGKRNAERRCSVTAASRGAARAHAGRARLSAFHHGTCGSDRTPPLSSSHATSWDLFGAPAPMVRKTERIATHDAKPADRLPCVTRGRYPRLAVPVQRDCTRSPVMMPSGRVLPKPPESRGDEPRPAGTALAPPDGVTRPASWYGGEIRYLVPHYVTICQEAVLLSATAAVPSLVILRCARQRASKDATTSPPCVLRGSTLPRRAPQHDDLRNMPRTIATFRCALPCRVHTPDSTHS